MSLTIQPTEDLLRWLQEGADREYRQLEGHILYCLEAYRKVLERGRERTERYRTLHPTSSTSSKAVIFSTSTKAFSISPEVLSSWKKTFPALNVELEIRRAYEWVIANPKNRKSNWHRFLVNWLSKAQDRAPRVQVEPERARPAILDQPNGEVTPMPPEIRERMAQLVARKAMPWRKVEVP